MSGTDFVDAATLFGLVALGLALLLTIVRIVRGPTLPDRVLALDLLTVLGLGFIVVIAIRTGLHLYLDIAIALALLGFLATVAFSRYVLRRGLAAQQARRDDADLSQARDDATLDQVRDDATLDQAQDDAKRDQARDDAKRDQAAEPEGKA